MIQNGIGLSNSVKNKRMDGVGIDGQDRGSYNGFGIYLGNDMHSTSNQNLRRIGFT